MKPIKYLVILSAISSICAVAGVATYRGFFNSIATTQNFKIATATLSLATSTSAPTTVKNPSGLISSCTNVGIQDSARSLDCTFNNIFETTPICVAQGLATYGFMGALRLSNTSWRFAFRGNDLNFQNSYPLNATIICHWAR